MMKASFEAFKLKAPLENLTKSPTLDNANILLRLIREMKNENFQLLQNVFLTTLLSLLDDAEGLKKNEIKTSLISSINLILRGSRLSKALPYRAILIIVLKQIFDFENNAYISSLSEELKTSVFECFEVASQQLDYDAVEAFMVDENRVLLSQCIFACREAIVKEKYLKIRKQAVDALMGIMQIHDKADSSDIVLREQISKIVFLMLPQISVALIKVCQEDTLRGGSLVEAAVKALGRFLCLIFEDYERMSTGSITNNDFLKLVISSDEAGDALNVLQPKNQSKADFIANLKKTKEWVRAASKQVSPAIESLRNLGGSEYHCVRNEFLTLSWNLLHKCLSNIKPMVPFLLKNVILMTDDENEKIREFSRTSLRNLSITIPELNQEFVELFSSHLTAMPRIVLTGDDTEQISGFTLLNSFVMMVSDDSFNLLDNPVILEKFLNVMLSCCAIDVPNELLFYEHLATGTLHDQFYQMTSPWKRFKHLKNDSIVKKFSEICCNIGKSQAAQSCANHLLDNMNSIEYLVLLLEILNCDNDLKIAQDQIEGIVEEFLDETYWSMPITAKERVEKKLRANQDEWFEDKTLGLYESAIEVRMRDVALDDDDNKSFEISLKTIKYNIVSTCVVVELMGTAAKHLNKSFQRFLLRSLHRVLEKAGSSNFLIRTAGLRTLESVTCALGFSNVAQLIDAHSDFLLFNIQKLLKRSTENDAVLDMLSVVFRYSKTSMTSYIKDIVETVSARLCGSKNTSCYLKIFRLYVESIKQWEEKFEMDHDEVVVTSGWDEFYDQCMFELNKSLVDPSDPSCMNEDAKDAIVDEDEMKQEPTPDEPQKELPEHIEVIEKILNSTLQFFASTDHSEVIATHEIFIDSFSILHRYEDHFLTMIYQMWYPFTKQFQVKNLVILQYSFRLLALIVRLAKEFVYKRTTDDVIPVINKFLTQSLNPKSSLSYTQDFKLQREIISGYGSLVIDLNIEEKDLDSIVEILLKYSRHSNESLVAASMNSLEILRKYNPGLINFKMKF